MKNALNNASPDERLIPPFPRGIFRFAAIIIVIVAAAVAAAAKQFLQFFRPIRDLAPVFCSRGCAGPHPLRVLEVSGDKLVNVNGIFRVRLLSCLASRRAVGVGG